MTSLLGIGGLGLGAIALLLTLLLNTGGTGRRRRRKRTLSAGGAILDEGNSIESSVSKCGHPKIDFT